MSTRTIGFAVGEYYHLYNRGNSKQIIFRDQEDYFHFMTLLFTCNGVNSFRNFLVKSTKAQDPFLFERGGTLVSVGAYVLMPNHFHILVKEETENGISRFMQKVSTAYVMYFNNKYKRTGGLFEGKFKSKHLDEDRYLKYIFSYIHLNPVKLIQKNWKEEGIKDRNEIFKFLGSYNFSSYQEYVLIDRKYKEILNITAFPKYFSGKNKFREEIIEWVVWEDNLLGKT